MGSGPELTIQQSKIGCRGRPVVEALVDFPECVGSQCWDHIEYPVKTKSRFAGMVTLEGKSFRQRPFREDNSLSLQEIPICPANRDILGMLANKPRVLAGLHQPATAN